MGKSCVLPRIAVNLGRPVKIQCVLAAFCGSPDGKFDLVSKNFKIKESEKTLCASDAA